MDRTSAASLYRTISATHPNWQTDGLAARLIRLLGAALAASVFAVTAIVVLRRAAGAVSRPLHAVPLLFAGTTVVALVAAARLALGRKGRAAGQGLRPWILDAVLSLAAAATIVALSLPGSALGPVAAIWLLLVTEEAVYWTWGQYLPDKDRQGAVLTEQQDGSPDPAAAGRSHELQTDNNPWALPVPPPGAVSQQLIRAVSPGGIDVLEGWVRLCVPSGQRTLNVHLAFCPPFRSQPELRVEQVEGPPSRVKTAQLLTFGARLEVKMLHRCDQPANILLRIVVQAEHPIATAGAQNLRHG